MEEKKIHPGSFLQDLDLYIEVCSSKVDMETLRKITTAFTEIVTNLSPDITLIERHTNIAESGGKTLRKFKLHYYIK